MKNLLDVAAANLIIERVERLQQDTMPSWGKMNATEMLLHCNTVNQAILLPANDRKNKTSVKQLVIRILVLYVLPKFPQNAKAPKKVITKGTVPPDQFNDEKKAFIHFIKLFSTHKEKITHNHPYFGNLTTKQWGLALWKHTDHHLRQFGV